MLRTNGIPLEHARTKETPMRTAPDPYGRTTLHGKPIDNATAVQFRMVERELGYEIPVYQGIGGADASAGTHVDGRAVDADVLNPEKELPAFKRAGFAVWWRRYRPGVWTEHYHLLSIFESRSNARGIAPAALRQIAEYCAGGDGLVGEWDDPDPWRPDPIPVFTHADYEREWREQTRRVRTNVEKSRLRIRGAIADLKQARALLDDVDPSRVVARTQMDHLTEQIRALRTIVDRLPPR